MPANPTLPDLSAVDFAQTALAALVERSPIVCFTVDAAWRLTYLNPAAAALFQPHSDELVGQSLWDAFPLPAASDGFQRCLRAMSDQHAADFFSSWPAGNTWKHISIYPAQNGLTFLITVPTVNMEDTVSTQITDLKQADQALRRSNRRLEILSDTASKLLASREPQAVVNGLCREVAAVIGADVFFNFLVHDAAKGLLHLNTCYGIPDVTVKSLEWLTYGTAVCGCVARDGKRIIANDIQHTPDVRTELVKTFGVQSYVCHPLISHGGVIGTLSFGTRTRTSFSPEDIELMRSVSHLVAIGMERIRTEAALRESEAFLKEADRAKDEFLAVLSHELQTPLTSILGWSDLAMQRGTLEFMSEAMNVVRRNARRQKCLVDDILDMSKLIHRKIQLNFQLTDLQDLVIQEMSVRQNSAQERQLTLLFTADNVALPINADAARIRQCLGNLLSNSLKFTPPHGTITVSCYRNGSHGIVCVRDTGRGMKDPTLKTIFAPFKQIDRDERAGGLGLGLAIAHGIIELHGGRIEAESAGLGQGSRFTISLPLADSPENEQESPTAS